MTQPRQTLRPPLRRVREAFTAVTGAAYTAKAGDQIIGVNRAGTVTITLPTAQLRSGRIYTIKDESGDASNNNITIATEGSETIDGSATDGMSLVPGESIQLELANAISTSQFWADAANNDDQIDFIGSE